MAEKENLRKENLEKKIDFSERAKYLALPALLTIGAYFGPNMHRHYVSMPEEKQAKYKRMLLIGTAVLGTATAAASGIKIYRDHKSYMSAKDDNIDRKVE